MSNSGDATPSLDDVFARFNEAQSKLQTSAAKHGVRTRQIAQEARSKSGEHYAPRFTPGTLPAIVLNDPDATLRLYPLKK